jgi:hypothetical protein
MLAGGEGEVAPVITGTIGWMGVPGALETVAHPGGGVLTPVRPAGA